MTAAEIAAYRILDGMQASRDFHYLRETNGTRSGNKQMGYLQRVGMGSYTIENERTVRARASKAQSD